MNDEPNLPLYLTIDEAVRRWRMGRTMMHHFIKLRAFRSIKVGARRLIDRQSGDDFFASIPADAPASTDVMRKTRRRL